MSSQDVKPHSQTQTPPFLLAIMVYSAFCSFTDHTTAILLFAADSHINVLPSLSRMSATLLSTIWCWWCPVFCSGYSSDPPLTFWCNHHQPLSHTPSGGGGAGNGGYAAARTLRCTPILPTSLQSTTFSYSENGDKMGKTVNVAKGRDIPSTHPGNYCPRRVSLEEVMPKIWFPYK